MDAQTSNAQTTTTNERPRRMLLDEWSPPQSRVLPDQDSDDTPNEYTVGLRIYTSPLDGVGRRAIGQRCGGGYRILRKRIGSS